MSVRVYTQPQRGNRWIGQYQGCRPIFACVLGFTETGLIPGISAAGATPEARKYTCVADAEFLYNGPQPTPQYPLPPLSAGASPVLISRTVVNDLNIPLFLFNAGLPILPAVPTIDLGGVSAKCVTSGEAIDLITVKHLFEQGLVWGERLANQATGSYLILGECVVGGTTTALAVLLGLGLAAENKVNSSHRDCNHTQKLAIARRGLARIPTAEVRAANLFNSTPVKNLDPLILVAAVGDPMQVVVAGMAIAASRTAGVLLAGGTQMLAVYGLCQAIANCFDLNWCPEEVVVGTTRWVAEDPTGDTVGLAEEIGSVPLLATLLNFSTSRYPQLRAYEQGYVKEGVGAGGCAIASHLLGWDSMQLLQAIEALADRYSKG
ncbi:nicotinate mononucleotide-dependent phosphoribosyltransferase CobT [Capilliphycus salinus ALCB114379]|uniref:nicotinate mononucleotide-dependent phosphoribosyltransferase CobT n=1 Tax=Capilliphycus salinus TaxID=2768948 RepID=UPI0039A648D8